MVASKLTPEERLNRKRQAARLRQQRCRARKKEALLQKQRKEKEEILANHGMVTRMTVGQELRSMSSRTPPLDDRSYQSNRKLHVISSSMSHDESPRSVYWPPNYSGHHYIHHQHSWSDQPHPQIRQVHSNDTYFPAPRLVPETRYESETYERSPYYQRYQPSPPAFRPPPPPMPIFRQPIFHPPVKPVPRLMQHKPHRFLPARHPPKHAYPGRSEQKPERLYREQIEKRESFDEVQVQRTSAKQSEQEEEEKEKQQQEEVEKSKEEAAVDAILSLKSGGIVAPPKIKRLVHREKASAFKIYDQARSDGRPVSSSHIETLKPGLYLTMRSN